jgi:uncharacterized protein (UPF0276 family)
MFTRRHLGHGLGLRIPHFDTMLAEGVPVDWLEVISENFMWQGGRPAAVLEKLRREVPIVLHGVSLGIGTVAPLAEDYLVELKALAKRIEPAWISDHLCWGGFGSNYAHDLLPLPYTTEALNHVVERVTRVQEALGRQILLENVSSYIAFQASVMPEWEFLAAVSEKADCGILLDINNVVVSAKNHGFSVGDYLAGLPHERVGQIHLAGHSDRGTYLFDSHDQPVEDRVWQLLDEAFRRFGSVSTLIERDEAIPPLSQLVQESDRAKAIEAAIQSGASYQTPPAVSGQEKPTP